MRRFRFLILLLCLLPLQAAPLKVAVLHPLLGDIAREIGGAQVEVVDLIGPNGDPHHFDPQPENLSQAAGAKLYLAAGMGLEGYLPKLRGILAGNATLIEVGATLPALAAGAEDGHSHDDGHGHDADPHWWHSIDRFRRASGVVLAALTDAAPEQAVEFRKNAAAYRARLDALERWARRELAKIPRDRRHLATTHAAFNYFCADFGFRPHPLQGLSHEQTPGPAELAALIRELKDAKVTAIFPEMESNPKILRTLTRDTGIALGRPLIADGTGGRSYEEMIRHNVSAIVGGLGK